jgi:hypothetical protein
LGVYFLGQKGFFGQKLLFRSIGSCFGKTYADRHFNLHHLSMLRGHSRAVTSIVACAMITALIAIATPASGTSTMNPAPTNPINGAEFSASIFPADVIVTPAWQVRAIFPPQERFAPAVFLRTNPNARIVKRQVRVGIWNGQECLSQVSNGPRLWSFSSNAGSAFEANRNWGAGGDVRIDLFRGSPGRPSYFKAGDTLCVTQFVTWSPSAAGDSLNVRYGTESAAGVAQEPLKPLPTSGTTYPDSFPAPLVDSIDRGAKFKVTFPPLSSFRRALTSAGFQADFKEMEIRVGRFAEGKCADIARRSGTQGSYSLDSRLTDFESTRSWASSGSRSGTITLYPDRTLQFSAGDTACVYQIIKWTAPEVRGNVQYTSTIGVTPNTAPTPIGFIPNVDLGDIDPGLLDGPDIILPDFLSDDESNQNSLVDLNLIDDIRIINAVENLESRFRTLAGLLGANQQGGSGAQQNVLIETANDPRSTAGAIEVSRREIAVLRDAVDAGGGAGTQLGQQLDVWESQLNNFAEAVPVQIAGGVIQVGTLAQATGFNATQSPVAGTRGRAQIGALSLVVVAPKNAKRGKSVAVRVSVTPRATKGVIRLALVVKRGSGIQVAAQKQVTVRGGKVTERLTIPVKTAKGSYTLTAALIPSGKNASGLTVQRPMRVG